MRYLICMTLFAALLAPHRAQAATCAGQIVGGNTFTGKSPYDPFNAKDVADENVVQIRNTGAKACTFALAFRAGAEGPKLGKRLVYALTGLNGRSLLDDFAGNTQPANYMTVPIAPNTLGSFAYSVVIARGQFAPPGTYTDTLRLELHGHSDGGPGDSSILDSTTLQMSYAVPQAMSVNIKGGGTSTTMNFEELAAGDQKTVIIQARSNQSYDLTMSSANHGVMVLTPAVPGSTWAVAYEARIDRVAVDLHGPAALKRLPATSIDDASHIFDVTIGDASKKRAGKYEDVVTIAITAAAP